MITSLTYQQKLEAVALKYYSMYQWQPQAGDYYTTCRADLELYQIVDIKDGKVFTKYMVGSDVVSEWQEDEFLSDNTFGRNRVHVPSWILNQSNTQ